MTDKQQFEALGVPKFDSLNLFHHSKHDFEQKLQQLLLILEGKKESNLAERFQEIEKILDPAFRFELIHLLQPLTFTKITSEDNSKEHFEHPQLLLHLLCLLDCTDSIGYIAQYLGLTDQEVEELVRELHHTFHIDSLLARVREYYVANKRQKDEPILREKNEFLGTETTLEPRDVNEDKRQRLKRRYGHLANVLFDLSYPKF